MLNLTDQSSSDPSKEHLEAGIEELEEAAASGRLNTLCLRALAGAARLLGHNRIADRADQLLREVPDEAFWAGAITNFEITEEATNRLRTIEPLEELERRHPRYNAEKIFQRISSNAEGDEHLALCLDGRVEEARTMAGSGVRLEEVGSLLAVLGEFEAARSVAADPALESFRQQGVKFVLLIELSRHGRVKEAAELLDGMTTGRIGAWSRIQLALAFANREPWGGYPFPDW
jgi:hypothetical protein